MSGTRNRFFFAFSPPLRMASGTSLALPRPPPTCPAPSPTTTRAANENRRPPFTTLATRLMFTTRSVRSRSFGLIGVATWKSFRKLELQPGLARGVSHGGDAPVIGEAVAVEHHRLDVGSLALLRDQGADPLRVRLLVAFVLALQILGQRRGKREGLASGVVHHLRVDVLEALVNGKPRPLGGARELLADAVLPLETRIDLRRHGCFLVLPAVMRTSTAG